MRSLRIGALALVTLAVGGLARVTPAQSGSGVPESGSSESGGSESGGSESGGSKSGGAKSGSPDSGQQDRPDAAAIAAAIDRWLASDLASPELVAETVDVLLAAPDVALPLLGKRLAAVGDDTGSKRARGVRALVTQTALGFLKQATASGVIFAGQYEPLQPLRPFVTELFFDWLLDTPDWYPDTHRVHLVPALRDLSAERPDDGTVAGIVAIVEDEALEPRDLRQALACMLFQWGEKRFIQPRLDELQRESVEGDAFERVRVMLLLADLHYQLRNYRAAAATHRTLQKVAQDGGVELKPVEWYWSACVHALAGQTERGMRALRRAVELQESPDVDSSHKVERAVWETDPEIDALRPMPGFDALLERALRHSPKKPHSERRR